MARLGRRLLRTCTSTISLLLVAAFLVALPLGGSADARKCTPSGPHCGGPIYCDDVGVTITGTDFPETIYGTSANDIILAKAGDDIIYGGGGDDVICGGDGKDTIFGEDGDDIIYPNKGNDIVDGGSGVDAIAFNDDTSDLKAATSAPFQFGVNLTNESGRTAKNGYAVVVDLEAVDVPGSVCATTAKLPDGTFAAVGGCARNDGYGQFDQILADASGVSTIEDVTGSFFPLAGANQPLVNGLYLRNYLVGDSADNYLAGSGGADYLAGHGGQDTVDYWLDSPGASVNLSTPCPGSIGGCGTDGRESKDALIGIEDVNGTRYDDHITGDSGPNVLDGGSTYFSTYNGNDVISGGNGDDILLGGTGTNTLDGGSGTDLADYSNEPGLGGITVDLSVIGPRSPGFSTDDIASVEGVIGTPSADHLTGDATGNVLNGAGGNDVLSGGGTPGGQSKDVLVGGSGTDTVSYSTASGPVSVSLGFGTASGASVHETLTQIENAVGSAFGDELAGTHGVINVLDGADGTDTCHARPDAPPAGDSDQLINCETTPTITPETPTNLSTDQTGDAPVLHGSFSVVDAGSGSVVYTVWDADPDENAPANLIVPPKSGTPVTLGETVGTITRDSPLSLAGVPLVDGQTYWWNAVANDGVTGSPQAAAQSFVYTPSIQQPACYATSPNWGILAAPGGTPLTAFGVRARMIVNTYPQDTSISNPNTVHSVYLWNSSLPKRNFVEFGYYQTGPDSLKLFDARGFNGVYSSRDDGTFVSSAIGKSLPFAIQYDGNAKKFNFYLAGDQLPFHRKADLFSSGRPLAAGEINDQCNSGRGTYSNLGWKPTSSAWSAAFQPWTLTYGVCDIETQFDRSPVSDLAFNIVSGTEVYYDDGAGGCSGNIFA